MERGHSVVSGYIDVDAGCKPQLELPDIVMHRRIAHESGQPGHRCENLTATGSTSPVALHRNNAARRREKRDDGQVAADNSKRQRAHAKSAAIIAQSTTHHAS